ncbi:MAG: Zn-ribbon domain-containing OB-fold protein [Pseudomonadales bacterium]
MATPPTLRTGPGAAFTAANLDSVLAMQACKDCDVISYPPREVCQNCLSDALVWTPVSSEGTLLNRVALHHSLSEFFKCRIEQSAWPIASVKMHVGPVVFAHLAVNTFAARSTEGIKANTPLKVFSQSDSGSQAVLIAVAAEQDIGTVAARRDIVAAMGLLTPAQPI